MKLLFACNTPDSRETGMAKIMHSFADQLRKSGHEVDMIFRGQVPGFPFRRLTEVLFPFLMMFPIAALWKKKGKHDLVAIHSLEGAVYVFLRKIFRKMPPCVIVSYGSDEMRWELEKQEDALGLRKLKLFSKIFYPLVWISQARFATKHADHVLVTAKCEIDFNEKKYGMARDKMTFIPNGVAPEYFLKRDYGRTSKKLLFMGGWEWRKGIRYLIEAFSRVAPEFPDLTLTVAGTGAAEDTVKQAFPENLRERVRVIPKISSAQTPRVYAEHDVFLFPSLFESMSLVLPEAMASGMPVITSRTCGMQDIVEDGVNGFLARPRDTEALAEKLRMLLKDAQLRARLGQAAQSKARELEWSRVAVMLVEMFSRMVGHK